ncbi:MAG TPA: porin [Candidatus Hydrothermia bacterium]|nr:hypothetical protein [Candidatus Hydrothermae bacterium]HOK23254.1 porin [Candidatus Hydrothermia bacterium]HOL24063.1 porin [Candidatus Hydrothermia bacterium]HOP33063.1 porin [Candidatus Hydrothermia bacterium]HPO78963.1 porin [Candidatus Hydrothermia bacterium]
MNVVMMLIMLMQAGDAECKCGKLEVTGYSHMIYEYVMDGSEENYGLMTLPYVRISFKGKITDKLSFRFEPNLVNGKIQYAYADLNHIPYVTLRMGKMKVPFGYEYQPYATNNVTPYLSGATRLFYDLGYGADLGIMAIAELPYTELKLALYENELNEYEKGYVGNLNLKPVDILTVGGSYYKAQITNWYTLYEGYLGLNHDIVNIEGGYIYRENDDIDLASNGFYAQIYRKFDLPVENHYICPAVKFSMLEPNDAVPDDKTTEVWAGFNLGFSKNIRLMVYYNLNLEETNDVDNDRFVMDLHFSF